MIEMKEKINACYQRIQTLDIQPTKNNMEKLLQTLYELKEVFDELVKEETDNGRTEDRPADHHE